MSVELKRIEWENGTLVSKAKANIDGTIYEVEPAQYSGKTPMSAENLKKMEDNTENAINEATEEAFINAYLESNQEISKGDAYKIKLAKAEIEGEYFELDKANYNVRVLKDCVALIDASVFVDESSGDGYVNLKVNVNDKAIKASLVRIINRDYTNVVAGSKAIKLSEGDIINLKVDYTSDSGNPKLRASENTTGLTIVKI